MYLSEGHRPVKINRDIECSVDLGLCIVPV